MVKWHGLIKSFWWRKSGHSRNDGVYWSKYIICLSVNGQLWQPRPVCLSEKKIKMPDCCCSCWNVMLSNCCTNFSESTFPPLIDFVFNFILFVFPRGGSVCLSWLLEPSQSTKRKTIFCYLFCLICRVIRWYCNTKKMCAVVYIIRPSVFISFYFSVFPSVGGIVLLYLTGWFYFSLTAFWK